VNLNIKNASAAVVALISIVFMIPLAILMWNELSLQEQYIQQARLKIISGRAQQPLNRAIHLT